MIFLNFLELVSSICANVSWNFIRHLAELVPSICANVSWKWEHVCTTGHNVKDHHTQWAAWWLTRKCYLHVGNWQSKTQRLKGEIPIVHSIQLGFLPSLGSVTLNEADESAMLRSKWTIQRSHMLSETARSAFLSTFWRRTSHFRSQWVSLRAACCSY